MNLLRKTLLYLVLAAIPVAIGGGWLFQTLINRVIRYEVDEQLSSDLAFVQEQLNTVGTPAGQGAYLLDNPHVEALPGGIPVAPVFADTTEYDRREKQLVPVRRLTTVAQLGQRTYRIMVKQAVGEFEEIAQLLSIGIIVSFLVLLVLLLVLNSWVSRRLWQPFYLLIDQLRTYRLDAQAPMTFASSTIAEFDQLGLTLNTMSQTLHRQYTSQKEFTDHAAHEMQTPLAVITTQLDQLLATEPLTDAQVTLLEQTQGSVRRLGQLNKSLLLLTKIDNNQFAEASPVNLSELANRLHQDLQPYAQHRGLSWKSRIAPGICQPMNPYLAEVLLLNLMKNALIHARPGTDAQIVLTPSGFQTINEGQALPFPAGQLFDRFVKNPARPESTGLGLALVSQIAHRYGMCVTHNYDEPTQRHTFTVLLPTRSKYLADTEIE